MKKISILASVLLALLVMASCDSDRDDNPVLQHPESFTMNNPVMAATVIDLLNTTTVELQAQQQPAYGFPTAITYGAQMSINQQWGDETSVYTIDGTSNSTTLDVTAKEIDRGIMQLLNIENASEVNTNSPQTIYIRMSARPTNMGDDATIYSNACELKVYPYFIELSNEPIHLWWLIGSPIGNGFWTKDGSLDAYLSVFPLTPEEGFEFSKKTGNGEFQMTLWLPEDSGFKIVADTSSDWTEQWGESDGALVKNDGGSSDIKRPAGFYTITLNTINDVLTVEPADVSPAEYSSISIIGSFNDWAEDGSEIDMVQAGSSHLWTARFVVADDAATGDGGTVNFKFRADHGWGTNWGFGENGGDINDCGKGVSNGSNIGINPGTYTVYFNDIDGYFRVVSHNE